MKVVRQGRVPARQVAQEPAHRRLVALHKHPERLRPALREGACDQFGIGWGHDLGASLPESGFLAEMRESINALMRSATPMRPGMSAKKRAKRTSGISDRPK